MSLSPRRRSVLAFVVVVTLALSAGWAADPGWKAGFAKRKITPAEPLMLAGYASRTQPAREVVDELHIKAFALEDPSGARSLLITGDLIGFRADFTEPACARITAATGIPRERILFNASHTHAGPAVMLSRQSHYTITEEQADRLIAYTERLQEQCVTLAQEAMAGLQAARLSWGGGVVDFPMNRREFTERGVILGVNPRGPVDRTVSVLRIETSEGKLAGIVFGAACHNTTYGGRDNVFSSDFAGAAQAWLEREFPGAQAMFVQGLAGDTNPYPNSLNDPARRGRRKSPAPTAPPWAAKSRGCSAPSSGRSMARSGRCRTSRRSRCNRRHRKPRSSASTPKLAPPKNGWPTRCWRA